jgi:hypothetical protein
MTGNFLEISRLIRRREVAPFREYLAKDPARLHTDMGWYGTPLHYASLYGNREQVACLVDAGANLDAVKSERSVLHEAVSGNQIEIVDYLLQCGAKHDPTVSADNLYVAAIVESNADMVRFLLSKGIDPHVFMTRQNGEFRTAYSFAVEESETEIAEILKAHGCTFPPEYVPPKDDTAPDVQAIIDHLSNLYGRAESHAFHTILPDPTGVVVHYIKADDNRSFATLFTSGMSRHQMQPVAGTAGFEFAELVFHLGPHWPDLSEGDWQVDPVVMWPVQLIKAIAVYAIVSDSWLGPLPTVALSDPPRPLGQLTELSAVLLRPDQVSALTMADKQINFYSIYPIYTEELTFARSGGGEALLERLESAGVTSVMKFDRDNTCHRN